ncbi:hypothetical protein OSTOST_00318 [Ostertagia ostertagi]
MHTFLVSLLLLPSVLSKLQVERKDFFVKKGNSEVFDETVKTNPRSFDYDFTDDLRHEANKNDAYDEHVGSLPDFTIYKRGESQGVTEVPVVTRGVHTWSTHAPNLDSFPYLTKSSPFGRTTPMPSVQNRQPIMPVMLHSEEVKRVRELLIGAPATADLTIESNKTEDSAPHELSRRPETKDEKELNKDFPTLAPALEKLEVAKESKKSLTLTSAKAETTTKTTVTTKAPKQVKRPSHTELEEVKKVEVLLTKAPLAQRPTKTTAKATTATTGTPTTVSIISSSTQRSTTPKRTSTTTSKTLKTTARSRARTTPVATTTKLSTPLSSTTTSWTVTTEPTVRQRPIW